MCNQGRLPTKNADFTSYIQEAEITSNPTMSSQGRQKNNVRLQSRSAAIVLKMKGVSGTGERQAQNSLITYYVPVKKRTLHTSMFLFFTILFGGKTLNSERLSDRLEITGPAKADWI